jgi:Uma2 family endonuclease
MEAVQTKHVHYPESDGKPMGETDFHVSVILYLRQALAHYFRHVSDTYVAADMFLYYEEGNPASVVAPDVFVVRGVAKYKRRTFKTWEEGVVPCTVIEVTSLGSRLEDLGTKRVVYEMLGVREYILFDPLGEYMTPRLRGYRLTGEQYQPLIPAADGSLRSEELGLIFRPEGDLLRVVVAETGELLLDLSEAIERAEVESERARVESERARVESERARVESERASAEAERADRAESELAQLRAEIERLRKG